MHVTGRVLFMHVEIDGRLVRRDCVFKKLRGARTALVFFDF